MLLIAPMYAGIIHSRCTFWDYPGEILLIILWMSYFLYPQLVRLPEARENRFSTEERAKFQQGNLKIYIQGLCHHYSLLVEVPLALYHLPHFALVEVYHR
jgi:hypothetical protein